MRSRSVFVLLALFVVPAAVAAQEAPARIVVQLPADAVLFVDGVRLQAGGPTRIIETPPLDPNERYSYTLRMETTRDGVARKTSKRVTFAAGETVRVAFAEPGATTAPTKTPAGMGPLSKDEQAVLDLVNQQREKAGLGALRSNALLLRAAREHSANMARQDKIGHELDGKGPGDRLAAVGYQSFGWGENVAAGQRTPAEAMDSWMTSEGHRANILGPDFQEIGIGVATSPGGTRYWTQVFGRPANR
jgi:uncharacterized protein (TIGR03000 family)